MIARWSGAILALVGGVGACLAQTNPEQTKSGQTNSGQENALKQNAAKEMSLPQLKVSGNKRFLVTEKGEPFFYLGDTAWELFHRTTREEAARYLDTRQKQGFTVIQAVAIAELEGHTVPNSNGHLPLVEGDPARPAVTDGPDNDYWDHVDWVVREANRRGMYVGFLPTWGRFWHEPARDGKPLFTAQNAETYGEWLGRRYRGQGVIWVLGGDRAASKEDHRAIIRAMARGVRKGEGGNQLVTFHPRGAEGSAQNFHQEEWLDFNMRQNGHKADFPGRYDQTRVDYNRQPAKPVLDGEPIYESHPIDFNAKAFGHSVAADIRRALYWDLFQGACGHTYGHHSVWQFWKPGRNPINHPLCSWDKAIEDPGAWQMVHGKRLIESRPYLDRIPADDLIVADRVATAVPGAGRAQFVATRGADGAYGMIYAPVGRAFSVRLETLSGQRLKGWWFNPRTGTATLIGTFPREGVKDFLSPDPGELLDWVLVLDDESRGFGPPGQGKPK